MALAWGGLGAEAPNPVEQQLAAAQAAWEEGDRLGLRARQLFLAERKAEAGEGDPLQLLEKQEQAYQAAEEAFTKALQADPKNPEIRTRLGRFLVNRKRFGEARGHYELALGSANWAQTYSPALQAYHLRIYGGILERVGQTHKAVDSYRQALELDRGEPRIRISLATAYCVLAQYERVSALLLSWQGPAGLEVAPQYRALGLYTLGYALEQEGQPQAARQAYAQSLTAAREAGEREEAGVEPNARGALRRLEHFLAGLKREAQGQERFEKAYLTCLKGMRRKEAALADLEAFFEARQAWWQAGGEQAREKLAQQGPLKDLQEGMANFREALRTHEACTRAHLELAACHLLMEEHKAARGHLEAAALSDPCSPFILSESGTLHLMLGEWEQARTVFQKLLTLQPEYAPAYRGLALASAQQTVNPAILYQALEQLEKAERLGDDLERVLAARRQVRARLQQLASGSAPHPVGRARRPAGAASPLEEISKGSVLDY